MELVQLQDATTRLLDLKEDDRVLSCSMPVLIDIVINHEIQSTRNP